MPTPVLMPQMGESIAEGTIVRWIKKVGDVVERDEPLFEISTDKVDAEIPAPAAGVLTEITVQEGETVPVNSVVGTIGQPDEVAPGAGGRDRSRSAAPAQPAQPAAPPPSTADTTAEQPEPEAEGGRQQRSSPLVRRLAKEHDVDISAISGTGAGGRVTKQDVLRHVSEIGSAAGAAAPAPSRAPASARLPDAMRREVMAGRVDVQPLPIMRRKIAEHMVLSRRTSAHVHSVFHVNFSAVDRIRQQKKAEYEQAGARLTYMTFIAKAVTEALRQHPIINASLDGDSVIYRKDINLGIAVALEGGLIVPVIPHADRMDLLSLSRAIADLADRARRKQLSPDEVHGGTFTITNPGQFGSQFGLPIINQPQVAILGVGVIEKRPIVIDDALAIRTMAYLTLGYDHRLIDGAAADRFMSDVKQNLENFEGTRN